jgi:hypothetical protein
MIEFIIITIIIFLAEPIGKKKKLKVQNEHMMPEIQTG